MPESGHYARRIYFNLYLRKVPLPELPFHLPYNCPEPDNAANFPSRPSRLTRLFLFRFFPSFQNEKCTPHTFPQIYKFIFVQQIFSPFLVIDSIESFLSSGIRNIFSFEKFRSPSKYIGSWSRNKGEEHPSIHLSSLLSSRFLARVSAPPQKRAIDSIDWIQTRFRAAITNAGPSSSFTNFSREHLGLSSRELEKACGRDWTARLHPTGRSVRASGISWPLPFPLHHLSSPPDPLPRPRCEQMLPDFGDRGSITRPEEIENKKRTSVPFVRGKADAPRREVRD